MISIKYSSDSPFFSVAHMRDTIIDEISDKVHWIVPLNKSLIDGLPVEGMPELALRDNI